MKPKKPVDATFLLYHPIILVAYSFILGMILLLMKIRAGVWFIVIPTGIFVLIGFSCAFCVPFAVRASERKKRQRAEQEAKK